MNEVELAGIVGGMLGFACGVATSIIIVYLYWG